MVERPFRLDNKWDTNIDTGNNLHLEAGEIYSVTASCVYNYCQFFDKTYTITRVTNAWVLLETLLYCGDTFMDFNPTTPKVFNNCKHESRCF
jgi:hypothetical protein